MMALNRDTELRKVPPVILMPVVRILEENDSWKTLMAHISGENRRPKYTAEHIKMIENACSTRNRPGAEILFSEWGTSGKVRPTLVDLVSTLKNAQLYRAADVVSVNLLNEPPVERPTSGPAARVNISLEDIICAGASVESYLNAAPYPESADLNLVTRDANPNLNSPQAQMGKYSKPNFHFENNANLAPVEPRLNRSINAKSPVSNGQNVTEIANDTTVIDSQAEIPDISLLMKTTDRTETCIPDFAAIMRTDEQTEKTDTEEPTTASSDTDMSNSVSAQTDSRPFEFEMPMLSTFQAEVTDSDTVPHFEFRTLEAATDGFDDNGRLIGRGGSGAIYLGTGLFDSPVAVKKLSTHDPKNRTEAGLLGRFVAETKSLSNCKHENIVSLLGYSSDGPNYCLLYEYLDGGTLQENIYKSQNFYASTRMNIAMGVAKGIEYLHCYNEPPLIHRDIKSANILLTKMQTPKLCDFGIIKQASEDVTSSIMGTSAYMAPEAFRGDLSVKIDIFSYGVILLELLTGLPPNDDNRDQYDIISFVENRCPNDKIDQLIDTRAGIWTNASEFYQIAKKCLKTSIDDRPFIKDVIKLLSETIQNK